MSGEKDALSGQGGTSLGPSTDAENRPVVDPTRNVLDLVDAAVKRQDDIRDTDNKWRDEIDRLRAQHNQELRQSEAARIDAIRAVDVAASQQASKDAETRATALAGTVQASAEALRTQVASTATQNQTALAAALDPIQKDIADLRRVQYESVGQKTQVVEQRAGMSSTTAIVGALVAVVVLAGSLYAGLRGSSSTPTPVVVTVPSTVTP